MAQGPGDSYYRLPLTGRCKHNLTLLYFDNARLTEEHTHALALTLASPSVDAQLVRKLCDVLFRPAELVSDVLVSQLWIVEHRAQARECALAVTAVE